MNINYFVLVVLVLILLICVFLVYKLYNKEQRLEHQNQVLLNENKEFLNRIHALELENSKFTLNPHLFKNTLNSIQGYAFRTYQVLEKLGSVLDYILYDSNVSHTSIKEELQFATNFIELNKIKLSPLFDMRVRVIVNEANPFYEEPLLAPLISAYFIENAFKHADLQSKDAFISIIFELNDDELDLIVSNKINKTPIFSSKGGIGKENMRKRLEILYGDACQLKYEVDSEIHTAHLKIKLRNVKDKMRHS
ncbi:MAG: signal transduction histidine kinase LytS [Bacteroidota bacterium]|nr:signal transduction histidine kinase LytS [Bacteroidota bacterium]